MREIKFRAWDTKTKNMMFTGFHLMGEVMAFNMIEAYIAENMCGAQSSLERWNDIIAMQYTGIKDANGTEIYEGDLLNWDVKEWGGAHTDVVEWNYELFSMRQNDWPAWCVVVGNIYDASMQRKDAEQE